MQWFGWQIAAFAKFQESIQGKPDFLAAVSGGGGKTWFAVENARAMLEIGMVRRVIVVTYTSHLVKQWDKTFAAAGLKLLTATGNAKLKKGLPGDVVGYICTFAALGRMPDLHAALAGNCPTLVIFDEIHHLGDLDDKGKSMWGDGAKTAFAKAAYRLALSGTPFRSNNQRIPFVTYAPVDGSNTVSEVKPDFTYSYGKAVAEKVCRRVVFHHVDGPVEWTRDDHPGVILRHSFADNIDSNLWGDRLRCSVAVKSKGTATSCELLKDLLRSANNTLNDIRKAGHVDAGGLIVASSIQDARDIKELLLRLTGNRAVIVHNEEDGSLKLIEDFREGIAPWIISVRMISEGVDIPRLRVCAYLTNIVEELPFMQILFRIVRRKSHPYGESHFFYPADARLREIVEKVEEEMRYQIEEYERQQRDGIEAPPRIERDWLGAESEEWNATVAGQVFTAEDIRIAEQFRAQRPELAHLDILDLVSFYHAYHAHKRQADTPPPEETYNQKRDRLRTQIQDSVGRLHHKMGGKPHNEIHIYLNNAVGANDKDTATNDQLERMLRIAEELEGSFNGEGFDAEEDDDEYHPN